MVLVLQLYDMGVQQRTRLRSNSARLSLAAISANRFLPSFGARSERSLSGTSSRVRNRCWLFAAVGECRPQRIVARDELMNSFEQRGYPKWSS